MKGLHKLEILKMRERNKNELVRDKKIGQRKQINCIIEE